MISAGVYKPTYMPDTGFWIGLEYSFKRVYKFVEKGSGSSYHHFFKIGIHSMQG